MSIQTKEAAPALSALAKAKGHRSTSTIAIVKPTVAVIENTTNTEVIATPTDAPVEPATLPAQANQPTDGRGDYKQSYHELKSHHDKTIYELREREKQLEEELAKANQPKTPLPKTKDEVLKWKAQYPDAYDFMTTIALEAADNKTSELAKKLESVNKVQAEIKDKEAFNSLLEEHPDAREIRNSPSFTKWFNEQPPEVKHILAKSTDVKAVSKQLTLYKLEVLGINPLDKKNAASKARVDASIAVNPISRTEVKSGKKMWAESEIRAISGNYNNWLKHREEFDLAYTENRVDKTK